MSLGQNIYRLRTERKMSQEDFAANLEVSRQSVSKWENDMAVPELEKLIKMAKLFEVSLDELVGNAPPQSKPEPAPAPVPTPAPAAGVTTGDLLSVVLLIFGVVIPLTVVFTSQMHNSLILFIFGVCLVPPLVTLGAAYCAPKNKLLLGVYIVYSILACILNVVMAAQIGFFLGLVDLGIICFWQSKLED